MKRPHEAKAVRLLLQTTAEGVMAAVVTKHHLLQIQIVMIPMSCTPDPQTIFHTPIKKPLTEPLAIGLY